MTRNKKARVFVFTDWHVQAKKKPSEWPPFKASNPPDERSLRELADEIHRQRDRFLMADVPMEDRMEFFPEDVSPQDLMNDGVREPEWKLLWAVIVDRNAATSSPTLLKKVAQGLFRTKSKRVLPPIFFLTPTGNGALPAPLARYDLAFVKFNVDDPVAFALLAGVELADASQKTDDDVLAFMEKEF